MALEVGGCDSATTYEDAENFPINLKDRCSFNLFASDQLPQINSSQRMAELRALNTAFNGYPHLVEVQPHQLPHENRTTGFLTRLTLGFVTSCIFKKTYLKPHENSVTVLSSSVRHPSAFSPEYLPTSLTFPINPSYPETFHSPSPSSRAHWHLRPFHLQSSFIPTSPCTFNITAFSFHFEPPHIPSHPTSPVETRNQQLPFFPSFSKTRKQGLANTTTTTTPHRRTPNTPPTSCT
jgi:hypothetical protein